MRKRTTIFIILAIIGISFLYIKTNDNPCFMVTEIPQSECEALTTIYHATDGDNWHRQWFDSDNPCEWHGIRCHNGHVIEINLSKQGLQNTIPLAFIDLPYLQILSLRSNDLTGPIPPELGTLTHLVGLDLSNNQLSGEIPVEICDLPYLSWLDLENNHLTGDVPMQLFDLQNLQFIYLENNDIQFPLFDNN